MEVEVDENDHVVLSANGVRLGLAPAEQLEEVTPAELQLLQPPPPGSTTPRQQPPPMANHLSDGDDDDDEAAVEEEVEGLVEQLVGEEVEACGSPKPATLPRRAGQPQPQPQADLDADPSVAASQLRERNSLRRKRRRPITRSRRPSALHATAAAPREPVAEPPPPLRVTPIVPPSHPPFEACRADSKYFHFAPLQELDYAQIVEYDLVRLVPPTGGTG